MDIEVPADCDSPMHEEDDDCEEGEIKDDDCLDETNSGNETTSLDGRKFKSSFRRKGSRMSPGHGSLSPSRLRNPVAAFAKKSRSRYFAALEDELKYRGTSSEGIREHLGSRLVSKQSAEKLQRYSRSNEHESLEGHKAAVDSAQEKENREDTIPSIVIKRTFSRKKHHSHERSFETNEHFADDRKDKEVCEQNQHFISHKKLKDSLKNGKRCKITSSKKKERKENKRKQDHKKKSHKNLGKKLSYSIIEKSKTIMRNKSSHEVSQENSLKMRLNAMLGGSLPVKLSDQTTVSQGVENDSKNTVLNEEVLKDEVVSKDDSSCDDIIEIPKEIVEPEVITLDSDEEITEINKVDSDLPSNNETDENQKLHTVPENTSKSIDALSGIEEKQSTVEDDNLLELRRLALESSKTTADDSLEKPSDHEILQLRLDALRSAYLRKHMERKKRGLAVKQKRKSLSPIDSPLSSVSPSNSPSTSFSPPLPTAPPPESIPLPPPEEEQDEDETTAVVDMELAQTDDEKDSPSHSLEDRFIVMSDSELLQRNLPAPPPPPPPPPPPMDNEYYASSDISKSFKRKRPKKLVDKSWDSPAAVRQRVRNSWDNQIYKNFISSLSKENYSGSKAIHSVPSYDVPLYSAGEFGAEGVIDYHDVSHSAFSDLPHTSAQCDYFEDKNCARTSFTLQPASQYSVQCNECTLPGMLSQKQVTNSVAAPFMLQHNRTNLGPTVASQPERANLVPIPLTDNIVNSTFYEGTSITQDVKTVQTTCNQTITDNDTCSAIDEPATKFCPNADIGNEETQIDAETMDLSSMIVLDEVGQCSSPEREPSVKSCDLNALEPQRDDLEEDEEVLRARVLNTLSKRQTKPDPTASDHVQLPISKPSVSESMRVQFDQNSARKPYSAAQHEPISTNSNSARTKAMLRKQNSYKGRNKSVLANKRSSHIPPTSLKVTIPADSHGSKRKVAESISPHERFVIRVGEDSDSGDEDYRKQRYCLNSTSTSSTSTKVYSPLPAHVNSESELSPVQHSQEHPTVPSDFERKVELLLKQVRQKEETENLTPKEDPMLGTKLPYKMTKHPAAEKHRSRFSSEDVSSTPVGIRLLPSNKQEEYRRLKQQLAMKEKQKQQQLHKRAHSSDTSYPEGPPAKFREIMDHDRTISISRNTKNIMVNVINDSCLTDVSNSHLSEGNDEDVHSSSVVRSVEILPAPLRTVAVNMSGTIGTDMSNSECSFPHRTNIIQYETHLETVHQERMLIQLDASEGSQDSSRKVFSESSHSLKPGVFLKSYSGVPSSIAKGSQDVSRKPSCSGPRKYSKPTVFAVPSSVVEKTEQSRTFSSESYVPAETTVETINFKKGFRPTGTSSEAYHKEVDVTHKSINDRLETNHELAVDFKSCQRRESENIEGAKQNQLLSCNNTFLVESSKEEETSAENAADSSITKTDPCNNDKMGGISSASIDEWTENMSTQLETESPEKVQKDNCDTLLKPCENQSSRHEARDESAGESDRSLQMDTTATEGDLQDCERKLVTQRYAVVDDLTEVMQELREIELDRASRNEMAAEVQRRRAELARAEERLKQLDQLVKNKRVVITQAHSRMIQGRRKCATLTKTCLSLGRKIVGSCYRVPVGGAEIMKSKLQKFAAYTRSAREAKMKDDDCDEKFSSLSSERSSATAEHYKLKSPSPSHNSVGEVSNSSIKLESQLCTDNMAKEISPVNSVLRTKDDTEQESVIDKLPASNYQEMADINQASMKDVPPTQNFQEVDDEKEDSVNSVLTNNAQEHVADEESAFNSVQQTDPGNSPKNCSQGVNNSDASRGNIPAYTHLAEYRSPLESLKSRTVESDPLAILCPFELMGSCQDEECQFLHQPPA